MTQPHPQRCETCTNCNQKKIHARYDKFDTYEFFCNKFQVWIFGTAYNTLEIVGCASHSSASEPAPEPNPCEENGCTDIENCDEICEHMRIYSPAYVRASRQKARADALDAISVFIDGYSHCVEDGQDYVSVIAIQNLIESLRQQGGKP